MHRKKYLIPSTNTKKLIPNICGRATEETRQENMMKHMASEDT